MKTGAGAESSDSTLAAGRNNSGRAALDAATRIILDCISSGTTLLACPPARKEYDPSLAQPETPCSKQTLRSCVCGSLNRSPSLGLTGTADRSASLYSWRPGLVDPCRQRGLPGAVQKNIEKQILLRKASDNTTCFSALQKPAVLVIPMATGLFSLHLLPKTGTICTAA